MYSFEPKIIGKAIRSSKSRKLFLSMTNVIEQLLQNAFRNFSGLCISFLKLLRKYIIINESDMARFKLSCTVETMSGLTRRDGWVFSHLAVIGLPVYWKPIVKFIIQHRNYHWHQ